MEMRFGGSAGQSSIISVVDISAEWKVRLRGEREFSEVASAEVEESEAAYGDGRVRKNWLSIEILSYCKGNCSCRVWKQKREGTSRGSKVSLL